MRIEVKFSGSSLAGFADRVAALGAKGQVELARGLNEAGDLVRTQVRRALKDQMGVTHYSTIVDTTGSRPATPNGTGVLDYEIHASAKGLRIAEFPVSASAGGPVTAMTWGVPHTFQRSFVTSKRGLLRARRGAAREPIRSLKGPSPAKELVKGQSLHTFEHAVASVVEPVVVRRLARLVP